MLPSTSSPTPWPMYPDEDDVLILIDVIANYFPAETVWTLPNECGSIRPIHSSKFMTRRTLYSYLDCLLVSNYDFAIDGIGYAVILDAVSMR